jgi:hypothetical protein
MTPAASMRPILVGIGLALLSAGAQRAAAQTPGSPALAEPAMLVGASVDYPALLLLPPRGYGLMERAAEGARDGRMVAYHEFQASLSTYAARAASATGSSAERRAAKKKILSDIGERIESLPGGAVLRYGQALWDRVQDTTNLNLEGYRFRLQVDDAAQGKLALKVQKRLH